jgi:hypothetical protein
MDIVKTGLKVCLQLIGAKEIMQWDVDEFEFNAYFHAAAQGFIQGVGAILSAFAHQRLNAVVLKLLNPGVVEASFFTSIQEREIYRDSFRYRHGCGESSLCRGV